MIPNTALRTVQVNGISASTSFGISSKDSAHIMTILRDTLYSDKVLAVLREYSSNAWDAHREAGKRNVPISVQLPTSIDPTLTIRDFGLGLSHEAVFEVFTKYGASTKRNSDDAVGMLGIGSKSGFAYSDTFTITSFHGGSKRVYVAVLDPSDKGEMKLLHEEPSEETGVQIQIPIKPKDIYEFTNKAANLYQYFEPRPSVNVQLPQKPNSHKLACGEIYENETGTWVAIMGCIAYRIEADQLTDIQGFDPVLFENIGGALYFKIGEVQINASREALKYNDGTKEALVAKFNELVDSYVQTTLDEIKNGTYNAWEKRLKAQVLHRLKLPVPKDCEELFAKSVAIKVPPISFTVQRNKSIINSFAVCNETRLLLQDDSRHLRGFNLGTDDYVIKPTAKHTLAQAEVELDKILAEISMTGVKIVRLSTLQWYAPSRGAGSKMVNVKHKVRTFKLDATKTSFWRPWSNNWEAETEREADPKDVYVILQNFRTNYDFYGLYQRDRQIAVAFNIPMPAVYGYKHTEKKPLNESTCVGIEYCTWRKSFLASLNTAEAETMVGHWRWHKAAGGYFYGYGYGYSHDDLDGSKVKLLTEALGADHAITRFAIRALESKDFVTKSKIHEDVFTYLMNHVVAKVAEGRCEIVATVKAFKKEYPLLGMDQIGLPRVWGSEGKKLCEYIKLVDSSRKDG